MAATTTSRGRLRRLAELRPDHGRVLSVYFDLDPREFATGAARASQINAILDAADKLIDGAEDLEREERSSLREDVNKVRLRFLDAQRMGAGGARAIAVFASGASDLFEVIPLAHPVEATVRINHAPYLEPLASAGDSERWCVALVSRRNGRVFLGDEHALSEQEAVVDDTHGQHQQGGWSQRRFERSVEEEKRDHLDRLADHLLTLLRRQPFDRLLVGGPEPIDSDFEARLHPYLRERLAGRISVDVETATGAEVLAAAAPVFEERRAAQERELVERLRIGLGRGDGSVATGREGTMAALEQQRVEILLLSSATGPGDDDTERAIEHAIEQSAEVAVLREAPELDAHGGIAALLRF